MLGHMGGKRGRVASREHEAAKGGAVAAAYGLTGHDILDEPTHETTLSLRQAAIISVEPSSS